MKKSELRKLIKEELLKEAPRDKFGNVKSEDTLEFISQILKRAGIKVTVSGSQVTVGDFKFKGKYYKSIILQLS